MLSSAYKMTFSTVVELASHLNKTTADYHFISHSTKMGKSNITKLRGSCTIASYFYVWH